MSDKINEKFLFPPIKEEIANSITHGLGVILSIMGLIILLY